MDGLKENGYQVHLAHTVETSAKNTKKYSDDYRDAFHLADLYRMGELAEGYIYPVAAKLARANYYMLRDGVKYDPKKLYGYGYGYRCGANKQKHKKTDKGCSSKPKRGLAGLKV